MKNRAPGANLSHWDWHSRHKSQGSGDRVPRFKGDLFGDLFKDAYCDELSPKKGFRSWTDDCNNLFQILNVE